MFESGVLDVAIGLIGAFILVSMVCTAVREAIESGLKTRAAYCHYAVCELLGDLKGAGIAQEFFKHPLFSSLYKKIEKNALQQLNTLHLPIGWSQAIPSEAGFNVLLKKLCGLLLTAFAATLGAPFWFDVLNRVMVIRATVKPHEKSPEEPSQDGPLRERPAPAPTTHVVMRDAVTGTSGLHSAPDNDIDACALGDDDPTPDEALPAATGGVLS